MKEWSYDLLCGTLATIFTISSSHPFDTLKETIQYFEKASSGADAAADLIRIRSLKGQAFEEVYHLCKKQIVLESHAPKLNVDRLMAWVEVLSSVGGASEVRLIGWLKKEVVRAYSSHPDIRELSEFLDQTIDVLRRAPAQKELPRIRDVEKSARSALVPVRNSGILEDRLIRFVEAMNSDKFSGLNSATAQVLTADIRARQERRRYLPIVARDAEIDAAGCRRRQGRICLPGPRAGESLSGVLG